MIIVGLEMRPQEDLGAMIIDMTEFYSDPYLQGNVIKYFPHPNLLLRSGNPGV
jgi:hypothetical protein